MGLRLITDEKLASVGILPLVGHAEHASLRVQVVVMEFIRKGHVTPYRFSSFHSCLIRCISTLNHKARNVPMKDRIVVASTRAERQEIKGGTRRRVAKDLQLEIPNRRMQRYRHFDVAHPMCISRLPTKPTTTNG